MASGSDPNFLLYPELMSKDELISVLKQRYIQTDSLDFKDKDGLVELYNQYILPLPQRKYRMNRRGREMTRKQIIASKKRRLTSSDNSEGQTEAKKQCSGKLQTSFEVSSPGGDRLKPPPSCIDTQKKKIKLNHSIKSDNPAITATVDKVHTNKINHTSSTTSVNKIKLKRSCQTSTSTDEEMLPVETRQTNDQNDQHSDMEVLVSSETEEPPKKKIKKISWP